MRRTLLSLLLLAWVGTLPVRGQPAKDGPEFQVNTHTTDSQTYPAVARDPSGSFVVVWQSRNQDGGNFGIFGQRYDSMGVAQGTEFQINTVTPPNQVTPDVAIDSAGNFVVVWQSRQEGLFNTAGVYGQRFDSAGTPQGTEFHVNTFTTSFQGNPSIAMNGSGNFVVVWQSDSQDGSSYGVFGQRFDSVGTPQGGEFQVNSTASDSQRSPTVAMDSLGNFVVVWQSFGQDGSGEGVFGQRFDAAGLFQGGEFQVNTYTTNAQSFPDITVDGAGNFVVVWQSFGQDGAGYGVFGQRFDGLGLPVGTEFQLSTYFTNDQAFPSVTDDGFGNFVAVWQSYGQDTSGLGAIGQLYDATGAAVGGEFQANSTFVSTQSYPDVAMDSAGDFVVAWSSLSQDGDAEGVFAQRFFIPCSPVPGQATNLRLRVAGSFLGFNWDDTTDADDYVVFSDPAPDGTFVTEVGTASNGFVGLIVPVPADPLLFYVVAGRNADCGLGPKH